MIIIYIYIYTYIYIDIFIPKKSSKGFSVHLLLNRKTYFLPYTLLLITQRVYSSGYPG